MDNAGITFNRFRNDQAFQQGFEAGGRILGQGSLVLGRYGRTISEAPYDSESEIETAMDQEADLEITSFMATVARLKSIQRETAMSIRFAERANMTI